MACRFGPPVRWFANVCFFHAWLHISWKSYGNHSTCNKIVTTVSRTSFYISYDKLRNYIFTSKRGIELLYAISCYTLPCFYETRLYSLPRAMPMVRPTIGETHYIFIELQMWRRWFKSPNEMPVQHLPGWYNGVSELEMAVSKFHFCYN